MSAQWRGRHERGSRWLIRLMIWLALRCGRAVSRVLLVPITSYFFIAAPLARRASRSFMGRALDRRPTWRDTFMHLYVFATTLLDRVYLVNGRHRDFKVDVTGEQVFWRALAEGRGCLLLGSHLGSFEMLGFIGGRDKHLPINIVMHVEDSAGLRELLLMSGNTLPYQVITLGQPGSMMRVKECLARGEVVGILADRVYGDERTQRVPFLGQPARFSLSPPRLATITGAPVVMVYGLFRGGRRYEIVFEPLATRGLPDYVSSLERHARRCPYNWFNFYDYWGA